MVFRSSQPCNRPRGAEKLPMGFAKEPDAVFGRKCHSLASGADSVIQMIPLHFGK